jgi:hypothetical protein
MQELATPTSNSSNCMPLTKRCKISHHASQLLHSHAAGSSQRLNHSLHGQEHSGIRLRPSHTLHRPLCRQRCRPAPSTAVQQCTAAAQQQQQTSPSAGLTKRFLRMKVLAHTPPRYESLYANNAATSTAVQPAQAPQLKLPSAVPGIMTVLA